MSMVTVIITWGTPIVGLLNQARDAMARNEGVVIVSSTAGEDSTAPTDAPGIPFGPSLEDLILSTPYELIDPYDFSLDYEKLLEDYEIPKVPRSIGGIQRGFPPAPLRMNRRSMHPG